MRLTQFASEMGITYRTAWNWYKAGHIKGAFKTETGIIIVPDPLKKEPNDYVIIYTRVSSSENKSNLESQAERLTQYAIAKGYQIQEVVKEIGSGINDKRPKLQKILQKGKATKIIVEHKDRITRFGFNYLQTLLKNQSCEIEVVNHTTEDKTDLMQDLISIITSFTARYYGLRISKRKTEKIIEELKNETNDKK